MPHVIPHAPFHASDIRSHRVAVIAALLALLAAAAVTLVLAIDDGAPVTDELSPAGAAVETAQPGVRADGGPDEGRIAAAVGTQPAPLTRPDESSVAQSLNYEARGPVSARPDGGPDESSVASSISGR